MELATPTAASPVPYPTAPSASSLPSAASAAAPTGYSPLLFSGVDVIDRTWGGLFRGGSYLLYGRASSGRDLLTLRFTQIGAELGESCLFISPQRPKDLMIQAASIGFDLRGAYEAGLVRLLRIPPAMAQQGQEDDGILRAIRDLIALIREYRPQRLVINDFMPFVLFRSFDRLKAAITDLLEHTDVLDMTMVLVMSEPGNEASKRIVSFIGSQMTGSLHLEMPEEHPESTQRRLTLTPTIGHVSGVRSEVLDLSGLLVPHGGAPAREMSRLPGPSEGPGLRALPSAEELAPAGPDGPVPAAAAPPVESGPRRAAEFPAVPTFPASFGAAPVSPASGAAALPVPGAALPTPTPGVVPGLGPVTVVNPYADAPAPGIPAPAAPAPELPSIALPPLGPPAGAVPGVVADPYAPTDWGAPPAYPLSPPAAYPPSTPAAYAPFMQGAASPDPGAFGSGTLSAMPGLPMSSPAPSMAPAGASLAPLSDAAAGLGPMTTQDRTVLRTVLEAQYREAAARHPFLVIAMRVDASAVGPQGVAAMVDMVRGALGSTDMLYSDPATSRLVAVLPQTAAGASNAFFTRLKTRLRDELPAHAEALLRAVEAVVIPDGDPFPTADALLAYALDTAA